MKSSPPNTCKAAIVNYNSGPMLVAAVESLLRSDSVRRVIVVDNHSTDGSLAWLIRAIGPEPRLTIVRNRTNLGFARACNRALKYIGTSDVLFVNPDCEMADGSVDAMLAALACDASAGMVGPLLTNPDGSEQPGGRRGVPTPWRSFVRAFGLTRLSKRYPKLFSDFLLHREPLPLEASAVEAISGACMLVRNEALMDVGPLDRGYFMHCEDLDWCMRFRRGGWKILFAPDAVVLHHKGVCSRARPIFVEWHKHRGMMRFYKKFFRHQYPGMLMWLVASGVWLRFGAVSAYYGLRGLKKTTKDTRVSVRYTAVTDPASKISPSTSKFSNRVDSPERHPPRIAA